MRIVEAMSKCKHPQPTELQKLVQPMVGRMTEAANRSEGKRTDAFNHQKTVSEFLQALLWIAQTVDAGEGSRVSYFIIILKGKPSIFIDQTWQSAEFYGNKILKEFKTKDPKHVEWVQALKV